MKRMFDPQAIALIGATEREGTVGLALMENLIRWATPGRSLYPINPNRGTVQGVPCFPSVHALPGKIDLAVIATPAPTVPAIVRECAESGAEGVIIVSAGFKEAGQDGRELERQLAEIRREFGLRIVGPNCMGIIRPTVGLNASFLKIQPEQGKIAFISQSGALGSAILDWAVSAQIGFSMFASLGSMLDADFGDLIDYLGEDPHTRSIILYMESVGHAKKFMSAARGFARNKPIIVIKPGRFAESARVALSHTGSMAGDDAVYDAAFRRVGVLRVREVADLFNAAEVLGSKYLPKGARLAIVTNAGGLGVMATDELVERGGRLASLGEGSIERLNAVLPAYWSKGNPIDVLGDTDIDRYAEAVKVCIEDAGVDGIIVIYAPQGAADPVLLAETIAALARASSKPIIPVLTGGHDVQGAHDVYVRASIPVYTTPEDAVRTYLLMYRYARNLELLYETPAELTTEQAPSMHHLKAMIRKVAREGRTLLTEDESKGFLLNYGIPVTKPYRAKTAGEAVDAAARAGYPVVLKIHSEDITHKTEIGGVSGRIDTREGIGEAFERIMKNAAERAPEARVAGVLVQKWVSPIDYELILGARKDKDFGTVILFGLGGIYAELFKDFSIGLPPLNQTLVRRMIGDTKVSRMLAGWRGLPPADMTGLEQLIVSFSNLVADFPEIAEIDVNPLAISRGAACALDARIVLDPGALEHTSQYPHLVITPYPTRYVLNWRMLDGAEALLRPIRPEDEPLEYEMLTTLSDEALRGRFFQVIKNITHDMLLRFCNIDYDREIAIVAEVREEGRRRIVGIGRLIQSPDRRTGEYAVVVHDDYQGRGLGYKLVDMLIGIGQEKGLDRIVGDILSDNRRMLQVAQELGFSIVSEADSVARVVLTLR